MKKALSLVLALALCLALSVPALAVESTAANLTPQIATAYRSVIEEINLENGGPVNSDGYKWITGPVWYHMCGGYVLDLGDGGYPEMVVAFSTYEVDGENYPESYIRVYTWDGMKAVKVYDERVLSGGGRYWTTYTLCQNGNTAWLDITGEGLPGYDYSTGTVYSYDPETTHYHLDKGAMREFTPQTKAASSVELGSFDDISIDNYAELISTLTKAEGFSTANYDGPAVTVNGKAVEWTDATPFIDENGRTMVPLRAVADAMDLRVYWDGATREASFSGIHKNTLYQIEMIFFPIGSTSARAGDGSIIPMDTAAVVINGRTYAPIRYLAEYFGYTVGWDGATRTVTIK